MLQKSRVTSTLNVQRPPRATPRATWKRRRSNGVMYAAPNDGYAPENSVPQPKRSTMGSVETVVTADGGGTRWTQANEKPPTSITCANGANHPRPGTRPNRPSENGMNGAGMRHSSWPVSALCVTIEWYT